MSHHYGSGSKMFVQVWVGSFFLLLGLGQPPLGMEDFLPKVQNFQTFALLKTLTKPVKLKIKKYSITKKPSCLWIFNGSVVYWHKKTSILNADLLSGMYKNIYIVGKLITFPSFQIYYPPTLPTEINNCNWKRVFIYWYNEHQALW